jgi:ABC-2 type transport system ATP-binding protein
MAITRIMRVRVSGPATMIALIEAARAANTTILSLSVQSTTLDDVFVHFTGHQLRDALQAPTFQPMVRPGR